MILAPVVFPARQAFPLSRRRLVLLADLGDAVLDDPSGFLERQVHEKQRLAAGPVEVPELATAGAVPAEPASDLEPWHGREEGLSVAGPRLHVLGVGPQQQRHARPARQDQRLPLLLERPRKLDHVGGTVGDEA